MSLFPTGAATDIISGFTTIVTANMGTVLVVFPLDSPVEWVARVKNFAL